MPTFSTYTELSFFPQSLPDETLISRASRYHLLSDEKKDETTFLNLFGQAGNKTDFTEVAPPNLAILASRLPGDPILQLGSLLRDNTFVPFVAPMILSSKERYAGATFGDCRACLICLRDDEKMFGMPYFHRSHQLPTVTACWKHGTTFIDACPNCARPFSRPGKLLKHPMIPCRCRWQIADQVTVIKASDEEHNFAIHAHHVLATRTKQTIFPALVHFFEREIERNSNKAEANERINRSLLVDMIIHQLTEGQPIAQISKNAAKVIGAEKNVNWWVSFPFKTR